MYLFIPALRVLAIIMVTMGLLVIIPAMELSSNSFIFAEFGLLLIGIGIGITLSFRGKLKHINSRQMFLITVSNWVGVALISSIPFYLSNQDISFTDAIFESVSGITTTGSTVLTGLDGMPRDILLWRSITQWIGGIGIIAMAVAVLPFLRIGGMRLFRTESSDWSEKSIPQTRKFLIYLVTSYILLSVLCILAYRISGMDWFDAVNHAMTTISTGGYSTHDASMGHFENLRVHWVSTIFMILGSVPFVIYVQLLSHRHIRIDQQVRAFLAILATASFVLGIYLYLVKDIDLLTAFTLSSMNVTSIVTTTGFASDDYANWGGVALVVFFFLTFIGGCSGSTSGGIKVFRFQIFYLILREQMIRSVHPNAVINLQYNKNVLSKDVIDSSISFIFMLMISISILTLALSLAGLDLVTSLTGTVTALMNVGPGFGEIIGPAGNFSSLPDAAKWILCLAMLLGRLEFLTIVILFSPVFWKG